MLRILLIPLGLLALLIAALAWSGGTAQKRAEFTFINRGDIITLDLNEMSYMQDFRLTYGIREGLYQLEPDTLLPIPAGAVSHEVSEDKKVWTFHLRPEARWSNGDPLTARDYAFSWRWMLEQPGEYTYLFYYIKGAENYKNALAKHFESPEKEPAPRFADVGIETPDPYTFRVTLTNPVPYMLELLAFPPFYPRHERSMVPFREFAERDAMEGFAKHLKDNDRDISTMTLDEVRGALPAYIATIGGSDDAKVIQRMIDTGHIRHSYRWDYTRPPHVVTNGPYVLTDWDFKVRLWLEKSDTYWDKANVKSDTIEMVVNENPLSKFLQYETGQVDWDADVPGELAAELRAKGRKDLRAAPAFGTAFLTFLCRPELPPNLGGGPNPLVDVRVRQALAMSFDRQFIVDNVTRMGELPARTYIPPDGTLKDYVFRDADDPQKHYSDEELRQMLASPGGLSGPGPGLPYDVERARKLLADAGYPGGRGFPRLPITYNTDSPARTKIVQRLQVDWKRNLGIDVELRGVELKTYRDEVTNKQYAISTVAWYGDYPDASTYTDKYKSDSLQNDAAYEVPAYDELLKQAEQEPDATQRLRMLAEAEHMLNTQVPIAPIYHYVNVNLTHDNVHGCEPNGRNITVFKHVWVDR
jgi:oligopeptide transport system substrate-binding protein